MDGMRKVKMETGDRKLGAATCRIRQCTALPERMRAGSRELTSLLVQADKRGQGYGTSLVHKVCREADAAGIVLILFPEPFDGSEWTKEQLVSWYETNFGFAIIQHQPATLMARMPGATPRMLALNPVAEGLFINKVQPQ